jgi:hypothetical protein
MRVYTVHEPPSGNLDDMVFVKEGFCWPALFVPVLWLIYRRLWLGLAAWFVAGSVLAWLVWAAGLEDGATAIVMLGFNLLVAFEANNWLRWTLDRKGYREVAVVAGSGQSEAEARYFQARLAGRPAGALPASNSPAPPVPRSLTDSPALGLYPHPERRP